MRFFIDTSLFPFASYVFWRRRVYCRFVIDAYLIIPNATSRTSERSKCAPGATAINTYRPNVPTSRLIKLRIISFLTPRPFRTADHTHRAIDPTFNDAMECPPPSKKKEMAGKQQNRPADRRARKTDAPLQGDKGRQHPDKYCLRQPDAMRTFQISANRSRNTPFKKRRKEGRWVHRRGRTGWPSLSTSNGQLRTVPRILSPSI